MLFKYGESSKEAFAKLPLRDASNPKPVSGPSPTVPTVYVPLGASSPFANNSCTVGARNDLARLNDPVRSGVICSIAPSEAVNALERRDSLIVWKNGSVDCGYGRV